MELTDEQLGVFVSKELHLGLGKRKEFISQVDRLIEKLQKKIDEDSSFNVKGFKKTGSLIKGTVLKPKGDYGVDADIAVFLDISEADKEDVNKLHEIILKLLKSAYPTKMSSDFKIQPRTLGIHFRESGLDVDLVPIIPILKEPDYGWQLSSTQGDPIKTSVKKQLEFINSRKNKDPLFKSIVRMLKKWRNEQELDSLRSFTIELVVAYLNDNNGVVETLETRIQKFFLYITRSKLQEKIYFFEHGEVNVFPKNPVVILDPANKSNNVAARITEEERKEIVIAAENAWSTIWEASCKSSKGETLDLWKKVFGRSFKIEEE